MATVNFPNKKINKEKLLSYGFIKNDKQFIYSTEILDKQFKMFVYISKDNSINTKVIDLYSNEEYILHTIANSAGEFVGKVRYDYKKVLKDIENKCFESEVFKHECTKQVINYVRKTYGDELEYLWKKSPDNAIIRRKDSNKWYAVIMKVSKEKIGLDSDEIIEMIDLKVDKNKIKTLVDNKKFFPGYHMNKNSWITICLDGSVEIEEIFNRINISYSLVGK